MLDEEAPGTGEAPGVAAVLGALGRVPPPRSWAVAVELGGGASRAEVGVLEGVAEAACAAELGLPGGAGSFVAAALGALASSTGAMRMRGDAGSLVGGAGDASAPSVEAELAGAGRAACTALATWPLVLAGADGGRSLVASHTTRPRMRTPPPAPTAAQ